MVQIKRNKKRWLLLKFALMVKQNKKMKVGATKIQPDGQTKRKLEKEVTTKIKL